MSWTLKNSQYANSTWQNPVATPAFANALTPGSIIIVSVVNWGGTVIPTPTDTAGNTYVDCGVGKILYSSSACAVQVFYALNTHSTASNVVSVARASGYLGVDASEWTGNASSSPVDVYASTANGTHSGSGTDNFTTPSANTTANGELIYGFVGYVSATITAGTNFTQVTNDSQGEAEYQIQSAAGSIKATWSENYAYGNNYGAIMVAFKAASSGTQYTSPLTSSMSAFSGGIARKDAKGITSSMSTFAGARPAMFVSSGKTASLSAFGGVVAKQGNKSLASSMSTFAATIARSALKALAVGMPAFAGGVARKTSKGIAAATNTMAGALARITGKTIGAQLPVFSVVSAHFVVKLFAAGMNAFSGVIGKQTQKLIAAAVNGWAAILAAFAAGFEVALQQAYSLPGRQKAFEMSGRDRNFELAGRTRTFELPGRQRVFDV